MSKGNSLVVAALDFGTTYSSWAFSFKHEYEMEPTKVTAKQWYGFESAVSLKAPTSILIKPDGETFHSFGFEAETDYASLAEENQHKDYFYFQRFKMQLYDKMTLGQTFKIQDIAGKSLSANVVFSLSIKYLKDDLLETIRSRLLDKTILESDIHWVLTVPAIWNDVAKQFMRSAAENVCC
ncbi:heat shock 70 kDa protein 12B-like [Ruditapes philippinarum]|uniref:heat shock 70 kDa protein 12B-like n=1 Tax=Ruditapes philippinarum TaxID=129788 RepID=UPI00295A65FB|nr:heat shock 70 kDa protein 12B-like [Ruditapes philippinarum]